MTASDTAVRSGRTGRTAVEALAGLLDIPAEPILAAGVLPPMWHYHGPLQVLVMAESLRRAGVRLAGRLFEYRLQSPAVGPQRLTAQLARNERGEDMVVLEGSVSGPIATARVREP
jgi:hypothetical protein